MSMATARRRWTAACVVVALAALAGGCTTPGEAIIAPNANDQELVRAYRSAIAAAPPDNTRELVNHARSDEGRRYLDWLTGKRPATAAQLDQARWFYQDKVKNLQLSKDWPAPALVTVRRASAAITIDGKGDEAAWAGAATVTMPYPNGHRAVDAAQKATCKLLWDDQFLYALYQVADTNLCNTAIKRDDDVWMGDCIELFITPDKRFGQYWEINVGVNGVLYDCLLAKLRDAWGDYARIDETIEGMKAVVLPRGTVNDESDKDEGYTVELAVPWSQAPGLHRGVKKGDRFWGLIARADRQSNQKPGLPAFFSHLPIQAWFHNIWQHGEFVLEQ